MACHHDGSIVIYDKEKEDAPFEPEEPDASVNGHASRGVSQSMDAPRKSSDVKSQLSEQSSDDTSDGAMKPRLKVRKSVQSRNQKNNPVAYWKIGNQKANAFAFSPDGRHLAVVSDDGTLKVLDFLREQ